MSKKSPLQNQRFKWWEHVTTFSYAKKAEVQDEYAPEIRDSAGNSCFYVPTGAEGYTSSSVYFASESGVYGYEMVDIGGMEHVTRHMIYSRFWHHFLYDLGVVNTPEPYAKRSIQGLILGPDGDKMSKSKGNVVDPLDIVEEYGADTLRTYVLFMGDYGAATPWSESSVKGCKKFLDRVAGLTDILSEESVSDELEMKLHRTIKKVSGDIENLKFNTAIASLMTLINEITAEGHLSKDDLAIFIKLLSPFAPHICEEIWEFIGGEGLLAVAPWPEYDEGKTIAKTIEIGVQVNGKVRGTIVIPNGCEKEKAFEIAKADERIASFLEGKNLIKEIYVPNKIVNFVAK